MGGKASNTDKLGTTVTLQRMRSDYGRHVPMKPDTVLRKLVSQSLRYARPHLALRWHAGPTSTRQGIEIGDRTIAQTRLLLFLSSLACAASGVVYYVWTVTDDSTISVIVAALAAVTVAPWLAGAAPSSAGSVEP